MGGGGLVLRHGRKWEVGLKNSWKVGLAGGGRWTLKNGGS